MLSAISSSKGMPENFGEICWCGLILFFPKIPALMQTEIIFIKKLANNSNL